MLVAFTRYGRDESFTVVRRNLRFAVVMATGPPNGSPSPLLVTLLALSAFKVWRHESHLQPRSQSVT